MKRRGKFVIILAIICVLSWLIASALFFSSYGNYRFDNPKYYHQVYGFEGLNATNIEKIFVNMGSEDIIINVVDGENATFNLTGFYNYGKYDNSPKLLLEKRGNEIIVSIFYEKPHNLIGISSQDMQIEVGIPKTYVNDLSIFALSGDIQMSELRTEDLQINTLSGEINLKNINMSGNLIIETLSGEIEINELNALDIELGSASGGINLKKVFAERISLTSISGRIQAINSKNILFIDTSSGEIKITELYINDSLNIKSSSGDIELNLIEDSSIDLEFESVSGDLDNEFGEVYGGENKIYVKTKSGELRVY